MFPEAILLVRRESAYLCFSLHNNRTVDVQSTCMYLKRPALGAPYVTSSSDKQTVNTFSDISVQIVSMDEEGKYYERGGHYTQNQLSYT